MAVESAVREQLQTGRARLITMVLAGLGLIDSAYLTFIKLANATAICADIGDCDTVNNSRYAEIGGIPIALLGFGAYLAILLLLLWEPQAGDKGDFIRLAVFGVALAGTMYSAYLTYLEVAVLRAICPYCVLSALLITAICAIGFVRLNREAEAPPA